MPISEVVLFVSSVSQACIPCIDFIQRFKLPVNLIRLDTVEARNHAKNGKYFSVTIVPTMVVVHDDGNTQMFVGSDKTIQWLKSSISPNKRVQPPQPDEVVSKTVIIDDDSGGEEEEEPVAIRKPAKTSKQKVPSKKVGKNSKRPKKGGKKVKFAEQDEPADDGIEFVDDGRPTRPPPPPTAGLVVGPGSKTNGKKSTMNSLIKEAQRMAKERESTLGYDEKDLPYN